MKKIISLLLTLLLVLSILPVAFADATVIDEIEILYFNEPKVESNFDDAVGTPQNAPYTVGNIKWLIGTEPDYNAEFEEIEDIEHSACELGYCYAFSCVAKPKSGYKFKTNSSGDKWDNAVTAHIGDLTAHTHCTEQEVLVYIIFDLNQTIKKADIKIPFPKDGDTITSDLQIINDLGITYNPESVNWSLTPADNPGDYETAEFGSYFDTDTYFYELDAILVPPEGWTFAYDENTDGQYFDHIDDNSVALTINGRSVPTDCTMYGVAFHFAFINTINDVAIKNVNKPVIGEKPTTEITVPDNAGYIVEKVAWFEGTDNHEVKDAFETEDATVEITLKAKREYAFQTEYPVNATVNNHQAQAEGTSRELKITYKFVSTTQILAFYDFEGSNTFPQGVYSEQGEGLTEWQLAEDANGNHFAEIKGTYSEPSKIEGRLMLGEVTIPEKPQSVVITGKIAGVGKDRHPKFQLEIWVEDYPLPILYQQMNSNDFELFREDLAEIYYGKTVRFSIHYIGENVTDAGMRIDDIKIEAKSTILGDCNDDGTVNTADAVLILKSSAGMIVFTEQQDIAGDCNHDGKVNTADAVLILKFAAGMITEF